MNRILGLPEYYFYSKAIQFSKGNFYFGLLTKTYRSMTNIKKGWVMLVIRTKFRQEPVKQQQAL